MRRPERGRERAEGKWGGQGTREQTVVDKQKAREARETDCKAESGWNE